MTTEKGEQQSEWTTGDQIMKMPYRTPNWILPGYLLREGITILYAIQGAKKSFMGLQMAHAIISGSPFLERIPPKQGRVMLYALEDTVDRLHGRMRRQGWTTAEAGKLTVKFELDPLTRNGFAEMEKAIAARHPDVLVVDPLFLAIGSNLDLNRGEQVGAMMRRLKILVRKYRIALLVVHHTRKGSRFIPSGSLADDASGSRAVSALADIRMMIHNSPTSLTTKILVDGKDREFEEIPASFDAETWNWKVVDAAAQSDGLPSLVISYLKEHGPSSAARIAEGLGGKDRSNVAKVLVRLWKDGRLKRGAKDGGIVYEA